MIITEEKKNLLKSINVEQVAKALGLNVSRHQCLCFSHDDHHPSLVFNVKSNTWKCYTCGIYGDCISLVQQKLGLGFMDACLWLGSQFGIEVGNDYEPESATHIKDVAHATVQIKPKEDTTKLDMEILEFVSEKCRFRSSDFERFLYRERHYKRSVVEKLKIGFVGTYNGISKALIEQFGEQRALHSGMVYKNSKGFAFAFNAPCLIFSYRSKEGKLQGLQARYLGKDEKPRFQFPKGCHPCIFNLPILNELNEGDELYVAEGVTDCISLMCDGHKAIAVPSATLLKDSDIDILAKYSLKMYPDQDEPGMRLFNKIKEKMEERGGCIECLSLPEGIKDYSEYYIYKHNRKEGGGTGNAQANTFFTRAWRYEYRI